LTAQDYGRNRGLKRLAEGGLCSYFESGRILRQALKNQLRKRAAQQKVSAKVLAETISLRRICND
jgi:hypothetical protein